MRTGPRRQRHPRQRPPRSGPAAPPPQYAPRCMCGQAARLRRDAFCSAEAATARQLRCSRRTTPDAAFGRECVMTHAGGSALTRPHPLTSTRPATVPAAHLRGASRDANVVCTQPSMRSRAPASLSSGDAAAAQPAARRRHACAPTAPPAGRSAAVVDPLRLLALAGAGWALHRCIAPRGAGAAAATPDASASSARLRPPEQPETRAAAAAAHEEEDSTRASGSGSKEAAASAAPADSGHAADSAEPPVCRYCLSGDSSDGPLCGDVCGCRPGERARRAGRRSSSDKGSPAGQPSMTTPTAGPWDSPQVVMVKMVPKEFINMAPP